MLQQQITLLSVKSIRNCTLGKQYNLFWKNRTILHMRSNVHCLDVAHYPDQSGFPEYCKENNCDIRLDLEILVLEHTKGSSGDMKQGK